MKVLFKTCGRMNISQRGGLQRDFLNKSSQKGEKSRERKKIIAKYILC